MNMAIDEALLEQAEGPALRFYEWERPALSFGYFGRFAEVEELGNTRDLVRRWTGGGIVLHGEDCTYSLVLPRAESAPPVHSQLLYQQIHEAICAALPDRMRAQLADETPSGISEFCFAKPVRADVLVDGKKIAGAAHRRTRAGLLHQGSVQHENLPPDFPETFAARLSDRVEQRALPAVLLERAATLAGEKYATAAWLRSR